MALVHLGLLMKLPPVSHFVTRYLFVHYQEHAVV